MATHSSILAWEIPWTEEPNRLQSWDCKESNMTEQVALSLFTFTSCWQTWCVPPLKQDWSPLRGGTGAQLDVTRGAFTGACGHAPHSLLCISVSPSSLLPFCGIALTWASCGSVNPSPGSLWEMNKTHYPPLPDVAVTGRRTFVKSLTFPSSPQSLTAKTDVHSLNVYVYIDRFL